MRVVELNIFFAQSGEMFITARLATIFADLGYLRAADLQVSSMISRRAGAVLPNDPVHQDGERTWISLR
jgi:hypothetical protein